MTKPEPYSVSETESKTDGLSRRQFIKQTAATTAAFTIVPRHVLGGANYTAPSDKLTIAGIGIGGRGSDDLRGVESERIVALCDVDWDYADGVFKRYPSARRYRDYREMLVQEKDLDAVVIATPDHTHAVISMTAMKLGKHVYCEKPLTRTVGEARALTLAAKQAGVATQMGNQGMAFEGNRLIKEWLMDGAIGQVREVHCWSDRPTHQGRMPLWWAQGIDRPKDTPPIPKTLDWDLWLGPAPHRPYHPAYVPFAWRGWWDFGSGGLGDMGIHNLAPAFSALKLGAPTSVHASSTPVFKETLPLASTVHYEFPARGDLPPVTLHWYDGGLTPPRPRDMEDDMALPREDGLILKGDQGTMLVSGWGGESPSLIPLSKMRAYKRPPKTLPRSIGHYEEWIKAVKEGTPTASSFEFAGPMTEAVLLGTVCVRVGGRKLLWDSDAMTVTNMPQANQYLHYDYRAGWAL
ncbi:MAG: Gfo/Idh/MocA family oxidoreductase [Phycisphaerae bacterium]|nr:Gfo/Idh/MocA family oxidoreductase [Phycisphaerae bacterium]